MRVFFSYLISDDIIEKGVLMHVEVSRRKFLQGSVALSIVGGTSISATNLLAGHGEHEAKGELKVTTKTGTGEAVEIATLC